MYTNFETAYKLIRQSEGGVSNRSKAADPGGLTKWGVTQATYEAYRRRKHQPKQPVTEMTEAECREIYHAQYARPVAFDLLPAGLDYAMFDFAIHSGPKRAVQELQKFIGVTADGVIGEQTLDALEERFFNHPQEFIRDFLNHRLRFLKRLKNWKHNANGWTNRINHVKQYAMKMQKDVPVGPVDYAEVGEEYMGADRGYGEQTLGASISSSQRSKAAVAGGAATAVALVTEATSMVEPLQSAFAWSKYAQIIGLVLAAIAFGYIVWHRAKSKDGGI